MERPGRNDPCPCGSGKKYKRCCLGKEEQRDRLRAEVTAHALPLLRELGRYAVERAGSSPERIAAERFSFWRPPLTRVQSARLLDYLIFDHSITKHGPSAAAQYASERGPLLPERWASLLKGWTTPTTLLTFAGWSGGLLQCVSALEEGSNTLDVVVLEPQTDQLLRENEPLGLRALPVGEGYLYPSWPLQFHGRSVEDVVSAVKARHHAFVRRERIVSLAEFLRLEPTVLDEEAASATQSAIIVPH